MSNGDGCRADSGGYGKVCGCAEVENKLEEKLEEAYWLFDGMHHGYGKHKEAPKSERGAFKDVVRELLAQQKAKVVHPLVPNFWKRSKVWVYDRYRFAVPLRGTIVQFSESNDGVEVALQTSNNTYYPIGCSVWVHITQLRLREEE